MEEKKRETGEGTIDTKALAALMPDIIAGKGYAKLALAVVRDELPLTVIQEVVRGVETLRSAEDPEADLDALADNRTISLPVYGLFLKYLADRSREARLPATQTVASAPATVEAEPLEKLVKEEVSRTAPAVVGEPELSEAEREKAVRELDIGERRRKRAEKQAERREKREERKRREEEERRKTLATAPRSRLASSEARVKRENPLAPVIAEYVREKDILLAEYSIWRDVPAEEQNRLTEMLENQIFQPLFNEAYELTHGFTREAADAAGELREVFRQLPKWERDRFRQALGTTILTQAELPEEERGDVRSLLEGVRFYFGDYSHRTMNAAYQSYEILARQTGFELRERWRDQAPVHSADTLNILRQEAGRASREEAHLAVGEYETLDAAGRILFDFLRSHGPPRIREELEKELEERRSADAEQRFEEEVAELFARELPAMQALYQEWGEALRRAEPASKEELIARLGEEVGESEREMRDILYYRLPERVTDAREVIERLLLLKERRDRLAAEQQKVESEEFKPQADEDLLPTLELRLIKAHILENAAKERRAEAEALREELRSAKRLNQSESEKKAERIRVFERAAQKLDERAERMLRGEEDELPSAQRLMFDFTIPGLEPESRPPERFAIGQSEDFEI